MRPIRFRRSARVLLLIALANSCLILQSASASTPEDGDKFWARKTPDASSVASPPETPTQASDFVTRLRRARAKSRNDWIGRKVESLEEARDANRKRRVAWSRKLAQACDDCYGTRLKELKTELENRNITFRRISTDSRDSLQIKFNWEWKDGSRSKWSIALRLVTDFARKAATSNELADALNKLAEMAPDNQRAEIEELKDKLRRAIVEELDAADTNFSDEQLALLGDLETLRVVDLSNTQVTDAGMPALVELKGLEEIRLAHTPQSDAGLRQLQGLRNLRRLTLGNFVTKQAVHTFEEAVPGCSDPWPIPYMQRLEEFEGTGDFRCEIEHFSGGRICRLILDYRRDTFNDEDMRALATLTELRILELRGATVTDKGLPTLQGLEKLAELDLSGTKVTDRGLESLKALNNLTKLDLSRTRVTDKGLESLGELNNLTKLSLHSTAISDDGLEELRYLTKVAELGLSGTEITGVGLRSLQDLKKLVQLDMAGTKVTDKGLESLKTLKDLTGLNLRGTEVTDNGLEHLRVLQRLEELYLWDTDASATGILELKGIPLRILEVDLPSAEKRQLRDAFPGLQLRGRA